MAPAAISTAVRVVVVNAPLLLLEDEPATTTAGAELGRLAEALIIVGREVGFIVTGGEVGEIVGC